MMAAPAPAPTRAPGALPRKFSRQTLTIDCLVEAPIPIAMSPVPQMKCATAAPRRGPGRSTSESGIDGGRPPSHAYTAPAALTVIAWDAMLKSTRWVERDGAVNVPSLNAPAPATIIAGLAPASTIDAKWTAYGTEIDEWLPARGTRTFSADATEQQTRRMRN